MAPKIRSPGITSGKATIEAQRLYAEAESRYGQAAEQILESFQPGQEPNKFLDGIQNAYFAGKLGSSIALKNSGAAAYLTGGQKEMAFRIGEAQNSGTGVSGKEKVVDNAQKNGIIKENSEEIIEKTRPEYQQAEIEMKCL